MTNEDGETFDHVDAEAKGVNNTFTPGGIQQVIILNGRGLYSPVLQSKLLQAKVFMRLGDG